MVSTQLTFFSMKNKQIEKNMIDVLQVNLTNENKSMHMAGVFHYKELKAFYLARMPLNYCDVLEST